MCKPPYAKYPPEYQARVLVPRRISSNKLQLVSISSTGMQNKSNFRKIWYLHISICDNHRLSSATRLMHVAYSATAVGYHGSTESTILRPQIAWVRSTLSVLIVKWCFAPEDATIRNGLKKWFHCASSSWSLGCQAVQFSKNCPFSCDVSPQAGTGEETAFSLHYFRYQ